MALYKLLLSQYQLPAVLLPCRCPAVYIDQMRAREKELGIAPDPEVDALLKAEAVEGKHSSIVTDLMLRVLGLEVRYKHAIMLQACNMLQGFCFSQLATCYTDGRRWLELDLYFCRMT